MSMSHGLYEVDLSCDSVGEELGAVLGEKRRVAHPPSVVFDIVEHCSLQKVCQILRGPLNKYKKN